MKTGRAARAPSNGKGHKEKHNRSSRLLSRLGEEADTSATVVNAPIPPVGTTMRQILGGLVLIIGRGKTSTYWRSLSTDAFTRKAGRQSGLIPADEDDADSDDEGEEVENTRSQVRATTSALTALSTMWTLGRVPSTRRLTACWLK